jgi:hypothetical protein
MEMVNSFFETAKTDNKRIFLQKLIKEIIVHPDKISIVYTPPIINSLPKNTGLEGLYTVTMVPKIRHLTNHIHLPEELNNKWNITYAFKWP